MMFNTTPNIPFGEDKYAVRNGPVASTRSPMAVVRQTLAELAERGHPLATHIVQIKAAMWEKKRAEALGEDVPSWAREKLSFLDEYQDEENLDDAIAAFRAALA